MPGSDRPKAVSLGVTADEVRGVIGAPGSNVFRNLRKMAKRPATLDSRPFIMGSDYILGSFMSVHPFVQSGYGVKTMLEHAIRCRAYELYVQRGMAHGHAVDDWLKAEAELVHGHATSDSNWT